MNRLAEESSPYLKQHANNPVEWYPWGDAALAMARNQDKPILLSIGYSSCHWCHVMAHESFEDASTAAVMNKYFVNVKVDREERPDLDKIYQMSHHLLTRQTGGWPLTMFLDSETLLPFFAGTYFPRSPRYNLPGFTDLLLRINDAYQNKRTELNEQGQKLSEVLNSMQPTSATEPLTKDSALLKDARDRLAMQYDATDGGFGGAPKFPMPATIERMLRHWAFCRKGGENDRQALEIAMNTLTKIARGGIYDHIGGGFCRYATDRKWAVPHFEKMLYDNGTLLSIYADAIGLSPDALFEGALRETGEWIMREMQHHDGGYFASLDADSEGEEGKFYVWRRDQVKRLLTEVEFLLVETLYSLDKPANFEGKWNFHRQDAWHAVVDRLSLESTEANEHLASAKAKLFNKRGKRVPPGKDHKILTSWNGLAIRGMAKASLRLKEPALVQSAQRATDFIRKNLWDGDHLMATWCDGKTKYAGYLDDYSNLLEGLITLLSTLWRNEDIEFAKALADALIHHFYDSDNGGFFFTGHDQEKLIHRPKPAMDDALPPGNGTAVRGLTKLGHLLGEPKYLDAAQATLAVLRSAIEKYPEGHCTLLSCVEMDIYPSEQIIVRGPSCSLEPWLNAARAGYKPWRDVYGIPCEENGLVPGYLPRFTSEQTRAQVTGFICSDFSCSQPIDSLDEFRKIVSQ